MSPDITDELERQHAHGATASIYIEYKVALETKCVEFAIKNARLEAVIAMHEKIGDLALGSAEIDVLKTIAVARSYQAESHSRLDEIGHLKGEVERLVKSILGNDDPDCVNAWIDALVRRGEKLAQLEKQAPAPIPPTLPTPPMRASSVTRDPAVRTTDTLVSGDGKAGDLCECGHKKDEHYLDGGEYCECLICKPIGKCPIYKRRSG